MACVPCAREECPQKRVAVRTRARQARARHRRQRAELCGGRVVTRDWLERWRARVGAGAWGQARALRGTVEARGAHQHELELSEPSTVAYHTRAEYRGVL
jgi:hypothetical protein